MSAIQTGCEQTQFAARGIVPKIGTNTLDDRPCGIDSQIIAALKPVPRLVPKGVGLYRQGEVGNSIHLIFSGWAFRFQNLLDGRRQILDFALPGTITGFGAGSVIGHGMETITDCIVASVPLPNVISLIGNDQAATLLFMRLLSTNEAIAFQHLSNIGLRSARERVACLIYELSRRAQLSSYRGRLPIKQVHIADALGLTNEHVCRTLKSLREDGLLAIDNNGISVLDIDELASEACASDDDAIVWANRYFDPDIYARGASNERSM